MNQAFFIIFRNEGISPFKRKTQLPPQSLESSGMIPRPGKHCVGDGLTYRNPAWTPIRLNWRCPICCGPKSTARIGLCWPVVSQFCECVSVCLLSVSDLCPGVPPRASTHGTPPHAGSTVPDQKYTGNSTFFPMKTPGSYSKELLKPSFL